MCRILVADDDAAQLRLRGQALQSAGHEVELVLDPPSVLRQLPNGWDLVIIDLRFMNSAGVDDFHEGLALIRGIREADSRVPVVVLSGWPDDVYGEPEEKMVSRVMMKPVKTRDLLSTVAELVPPK
jgi:CheY-like chemotaxis protein